MSVSDATLKALKELGLTEYETNAYLSMIAGGPQMAASDISSKSHVPYSRIYDVLGRLEEKGFISISKGRPTLYTANASCLRRRDRLSSSPFLAGDKESDRRHS